MLYFHMLHYITCNYNTKKHKCGLIMLLSLNSIKYENPDSLSLPFLKVVDTDQGINLEWL